jgi:uncharacterized integral membrane protein
MSSAQPPERPSERSPARLIALCAIGLFLLLFIILNSHEVKVSFVILSARVPLVFALVLAIGLGFAAGWLVRGRRGKKMP